MKLLSELAISPDTNGNFDYMISKTTNSITCYINGMSFKILRRYNEINIDTPFQDITIKTRRVRLKVTINTKMEKQEVEDFTCRYIINREIYDSYSGLELSMELVDIMRILIRRNRLSIDDIRCMLS